MAIPARTLTNVPMLRSTIATTLQLVQMVLETTHVRVTLDLTVTDLIVRTSMSVT